MAKTHFIVGYGGQPKRFLSVRENEQGRLLITVHVPSTRRMPNGVVTQAVEHRFTVHPSPKSASGATTIHKTATYTNGHRESLHILTHAPKVGCYQTVEITSIGGLGNKPPFEMTNRVYNLADYNPQTHKMRYAIWIAAADADEPKLTTCQTCFVRFKRFSILIPFCFTREPTGPTASTKSYCTSSPELLTEDEITAGHVPGIAHGVTFRDIEAAVVFDFNDLIRMEQIKRPGKMLFPRDALRHEIGVLYSAKPEP